MSLQLHEAPTSPTHDDERAQPRLSGAATPVRKRRRRLGWLGALAAGLGGMLLGAGMLLVVLVLLAPQPVSPRARVAAGANLTLAVPDAYLTATVAQALAHAALPTRVSDVQVHVAAGGRVEVSGALPELPTFPGQPPRRFLCALTLTFDGAHLVARVDSFTVGALELPAPLTQALESAFSAQVPGAATTLLARSPFTLTGISSAAGLLTLALRTR